MLFVGLLITVFFPVAHAQIADSSFFPMISSINPGVVHMRRGGIIAVDKQRNSLEKKHMVPVGGIQDGIKTEVHTDTNTGFIAFATRPVSGEFTIKADEGKKEEKAYSNMNGDYLISNEATATYLSGTLDFRYFGVSYASSDYEYLDEFKLGEIPTLEKYDENVKLKYRNYKIGSAIKIGNFRAGVYYLDQEAKGHFIYLPYNATSGATHSSTKYPVQINNRGAGGGLGYTLPSFRLEVSFEKLMAGKMELSSSYPLKVKEPDNAERFSTAAEVKLFSWLNLGVRYRRIKGNYVDLEDIISYNLLYSSMGADDYRNEVIYNFGFGDNMGFSPSFFIMQSSVTTMEESPVYSDGQEYKAKTIATTMGATLSFRF